MVAAFEGDPGPWLEVNRALRDALISYAADGVPTYRSVIRPGMPFEEIPILTKDVVRAIWQSPRRTGRWAGSRS
jgi:hypothetical protein